MGHTFTKFRKKEPAFVHMLRSIDEMNQAIKWDLSKFKADEIQFILDYACSKVIQDGSRVSDAQFINLYTQARLYVCDLTDVNHRLTLYRPQLLKELTCLNLYP